MDVLLRSCGVEKPERGLTTTHIVKIEKRIRKKTWSLRYIIVEEKAYPNRGAWNRLQVVCVHSHVRPRISQVEPSKILINAAKQADTKIGQLIEMVELMTQLKGNPQSLTKMKRAFRIILSVLISGIQMQWKQMPCGF